MITHGKLNEGNSGIYEGTKEGVLWKGRGSEIYK